MAFRLPDKKNLIDLIKKVGPLVAPSANPEDMSPAKNIKEARRYFGEAVDFYVDEGDLVSGPSTLVKILGDNIEVVREGAVKLSP